jgi:hypothetical protein
MRAPPNPTALNRGRGTRRRPATRPADSTVNAMASASKKAAGRQRDATHTPLRTTVRGSAKPTARQQLAAASGRGRGRSRQPAPSQHISTQHREPSQLASGRGSLESDQVKSPCPRMAPLSTACLRVAGGPRNTARGSSAGRCDRIAVYSCRETGILVDGHTLSPSGSGLKRARPHLASGDDTGCMSQRG